MIYGQVAKGVLILVVMILAFAIIPVIGNIPVCIAAVIDAYMVGKVLRAGQPVGKWQWFPSLR